MGRFIVWGEGETESVGRKISAPTARTAAEEWADDCDRRSLEHHIANGSSALVYVRNLDDDSVRRWLVGGEVFRQYTAKLWIDRTKEPT